MYFPRDRQEVWCSEADVGTASGTNAESLLPHSVSPEAAAHLAWVWASLSDFA